MLRTLFVGVLFALAACTTETPTNVTTEVQQNRLVTTNSTYIVRFDDNIPNVQGKVSSILRKYNTGKTLFVYQHTIKGMAVQAPDSVIALIRTESGVLYVEKDGIATNSQTWGLDRIDQRTLPLNTLYEKPNSGEGVTAYILDTGIRPTHPEFSGRVVTGRNFVDTSTSTDDCHGHGTHVAGTVGGNLYGVANKVNLVPVRVLGCTGNGSWSGIIAGMDWVGSTAVKPAVVNMSIGGGYSQAVNDAATRLVQKNIPVVVSAGNSARDACLQSPAATPLAITVGATDINDNFASFSNFGNCVDILAPGVSITSANYLGGSWTISGTSMASPHVAGVVAQILSKNPAATSTQVTNQLLNKGTVGVIRTVPVNTPNILLYNTALFGFDSLPITPILPTVKITKTCSSFTCTFNGQQSFGTGTLRYQWNVSNGQTGTATILTSTFPQQNRTYIIKLRITDNVGTSVDSVNVSCNARGRSAGCK